MHMRKEWTVVTNECGFMKESKQLPLEYYCETTIQKPKIVNSVAFSKDGKKIVSGSNDSCVNIWDVPTGECIFNNRHSLRITSVAFRKDGKKFVSGSADHTVKIWNFCSKIERDLIKCLSQCLKNLPICYVLKDVGSQDGGLIAKDLFRLF